jgi:CBS domain-containing protein
MLIKDVLHDKGHDVIKVGAADSVALAVRKLAQYRIGALVVESQWMKPIGIFSERDFVNAIARDGAAVLNFAVQQLMSAPIINCRSSDRIDAALVAMTLAKVRHLPVIDDGVLPTIGRSVELVWFALQRRR